MDTLRLVVGQMQSNCYIVPLSRELEAVIIDPGDDSAYIIDEINRLALRPVSILLTHGHFDHCMAAFEVQHAFSIPCFLASEDMFLLQRMQETATHFLHGDCITIAPEISEWFSMPSIVKENVIITHLPGHTPGSVGYFYSKQNALFVGDCIFSDGSTGRVDFSYGNSLDMQESLLKLRDYSVNTMFYPGHGSSIIKSEIFR